ncbi:MAG: hypothetical protein AAGI15_03425 [Pseudomonadota bacterium]
MAQRHGPWHRARPQRATRWLVALLAACTPFVAGAEGRGLFEAGPEATGGNLPPPLAITLTGPWQVLARDRATEPEYRPATLALTDGGVMLDAEVRPRGKSRRKPSNCRFPPLWLRLDKKAIPETPFAGHHRRKLVTHCGPLTRSGDPSKVWLEMLAYRTLNQLTDHSFRVAPLSITYVDSDRPARRHLHAGFLIEHKKELARRLSLTAAKGPRVDRANLDAAHGALVSLFAYMIGNPDFSLARGPAGDDCCHNAVPLVNAQNRVFSVPYDFDNTGLVNPRYAAPPANLNLRNVRQRSYRGYCRFNDALPAVSARLLNAQPAIRSLFSQQPELSVAERKRALRYLDAFFAELARPDAAARLQERCIG